MEDRIEYFERMLANDPDNPTGLLALANEYQKAGRYEDEATVLERYVSLHGDDEGNAYARLGDVLSRLRKDEARAVYKRGVRQAEKFGHGGQHAERDRSGDRNDRALTVGGQPRRS